MDAYYKLGNSYHHGRGVEIDMKKAKHFYELGAMNGNVQARHNLGVMEAKAGNQRATKHFILAARAGHDEALDVVKKGFIVRLVVKEEYESTLRAYQKSVDEMKSEARDKVADIIARSAVQLS